MDSLNAVSVYVQQFVCLDQHLDLWPQVCKCPMKFSLSHIAEAYVNNPRRRSSDNNPIREIGVLRHNHQSMDCCVIPNLTVGWVLANC